MPIPRTTLLRTALRPVAATLRNQPFLAPAQTRLATGNTGPNPERDPSKGPVYNGPGKEFSKDGTGSNTNIIRLGAAVLAIGGVYMMFMARPEVVAGKAEQGDPSKPAR
ncbi:hypothetical protein B0T22DRAFT_34770 [Podospora appendiculata]|uniref:Uncharacterized protein n=1 Tax=Podospora appendiculata TaxID=314037 RepID=A0AAE1CG12_9PEZI|nr:hypothetical protein B0T22DRAFT_34770 [Podospora appendiculata]